MQDTPRKTSQEIDKIIDLLNARWDLQLPRVRGTAAVKAGDGSDLGRKCSSRIRALCWKGTVNMNSVVEEFEDKVQHKYSRWIWKPSQTSGTLPSLPVSKSFLRRDAISKTPGLSQQGRQTFLKALSGLLEEEYKLATESDQYQRTPSASRTDSSRQISFMSNPSISTGSFITAAESHPTTARAANMRDASRPDTPRSTSVKKREASQTTTSSSKRAKTATPQPVIKPTARQQSLDSMLRRLNSHVSELVNPQTAVNQSFDTDPNVRSFTTNASEDPDRIFSEPASSTPSSNATSFMSINGSSPDQRISDIPATQYSGDTELDEAHENDINLHISYRESETSVSLASFTKPMHVLSEHGLSHSSRPLPTNLPYWYTFELYRISQCWSVDVHWLRQKIQRSQQEKQLSPHELWQAVKLIRQEIKNDQQKSSVLPAKFSIPTWISNGSYYNADSGDSLAFTAKLDISPGSTNEPLDFKLNPTKSDRSCRFHRQFGADRFLAVDMPYYDQASSSIQTNRSPQAQESVESLHDSVFQRLTTKDLHIAGRTWRAFYVEPIKSRSKKKRKEEGPRQRLHLFAVDGFDFGKSDQSQSTRHRPISLLDFIRWHLPLEQNRRSTDMKLFARIQLGLSKTLPTIVLEPHEFIDTPDIIAQHEGKIVADGAVMTDGCARISYDLAWAVWKQLGKLEKDFPSTFQARIGGAKGLWQVDYTKAHPDTSKRGFWLEVRDSQLKIKPHPRYREDADESQRTFEVVKYSSACLPGHLNIQLINIMHYCGVSRDSFREALNADLAEYLTTLGAAVNDPLKLRVWRQENHRAPSDAIEFCGGMPASKEDELDYLLESGFASKSCRYLNRCLKNLVKQELDGYVDKLRIKVDASTIVFCIPDPIGILKPGEIQLNFSTPKTQPLTNFQEMCLRCDKVLVARNPAHLASDVQLVKAVYCDELRHLKDVAIFSTQGHYPLADLLSGGDYDGDIVTVIWDPKLTENFQNREKPRLAEKVKCGVVSETKLVSQVFDVKNPTLEQLQSFLHNCCSLNGFQSRLGEVTVEHEMLVYAGIDNLGKPGAEMLAALAGYLVDSAKQGDSFNHAAWMKLRARVRRACKIPNPKQPAYKKDIAPRGKEECANIIDYLKFDVAKGLRNSVLTKFEDEWTSKSVVSDADLSRLYSHERARANNSQEKERHAVGKVLDDLCKKIEVISEEWRRRGGPDDDDMPGAEFRRPADRSDFARDVRELTEQVRAIEPLNIDCDIRHDYERHGGGKGTRWSLLRASCMQYKHQTGSMSWKLVGNELCTIKARASGPTWEMTLAVRELMKVDGKKYRRLNEEEDGDAVDFYDAEE